MGQTSQAMPVSADDIRRWILEEMARPDGGASDIFVEAARLRGYSRIFKARLPGIADAVAIKLFLHPDDCQPPAQVAGSPQSALSPAWEAAAPNPQVLALISSPRMPCNWFG